MEQAKEFIKFITARAFTGIVDFVGQILLVEFVFMNDFVAKFLLIILTTILNYFLCEFAVFRQKET